MPQVPKMPVYGGPSVASIALPDAQQSSVVTPALLNAGNEWTGQVGRSLQQYGSELAQKEAEQQKLRDMDMVNRAELAYSAEEQDYLSSLNKRQGMNAWGATKDTEQWVRDRFKEHSDILENDTQRRAFEMRFGERATRLRGQAMDFEDKQMKVSYAEARQAQVGLAISDAAANPSLMPQSRAKIDGVINDISQAQGWDADTTKAKRLEYTTQLHTQIIQSLEPSAAADYFQAHKDEIDGSKHDAIKKTYETEARLKTTQTYGDAYESKLRDGSMTLQAALDDIGKRFDGQQEHELKLEIKQRIADADAAREKGQRSAADEAWKIYTQTRRLSAIPATLRAQMDGRDLLALEDDAKRRAEAGIKKEAKFPDTDWETYYGLRRMAINEPDKFKGEDLRRYFPRLGKSEREGLIDLQGKADKPTEIKDVATLEQQLGNAHDQLGIVGDGNAPKRGNFDRIATETIAAEENKLGKKLDYNGRQAILDRLMMDGKLPGRIFDTKKRQYEVVGTPDAKNFIPSDDAIIARFQRKKGRAPSADELATLKQSLKAQQ